MPFCPKCQYEYNNDVSRCPDCDEPLVLQLPDEDDDYEGEIDYSDWVHIAKMTSVDYAKLLSEVFEAKDIPAVVKSGTGHFGYIGAMGSASFVGIDGAISIYVPNEFVAEADIEADIVLGEIWRKSRLIETEIEYDDDDEFEIEDDDED